MDVQCTLYTAVSCSRTVQNFFIQSNWEQNLPILGRIWCAAALALLPLHPLCPNFLPLSPSIGTMFGPTSPPGVSPSSISSCCSASLGTARSKAIPIFFGRPFFLFLWDQKKKTEDPLEIQDFSRIPVPWCEHTSSPKTPPLKSPPRLYHQRWMCSTASQVYMAETKFVEKFGQNCVIWSKLNLVPVLTIFLKTNYRYLIKNGVPNLSHFRPKLYRCRISICRFFFY